MKLQLCSKVAHIIMLKNLKQRLFQPSFSLEGSYNFFVDVAVLGSPGYSNSSIMVNCFNNEHKQIAIFAQVTFNVLVGGELVQLNT